uniref:Proteasome subunit beta n=1 Tax=Megaselia scalaris TaxID=36166 RepID=T1GRS7_MEGSC
MDLYWIWSIVAIAGKGFSIIAADTRLSSGYSIHTRKQKKTFKLTNNTVLGSTGCWCDTLSLTSLLSYRMQSYVHTHQKTMSTNAIAQLISVMMYNKRFFPYYVSNILAGLDEEGNGVIYSYDPIGHCEKTTYRAGGTAGALLQPEKAISIAIDTFISASERDIYTGDSVVICVITKDGIEEKTENLVTLVVLLLPLTLFHPPQLLYSRDVISSCRAPGPFNV